MSDKTERRPDQTSYPTDDYIRGKKILVIGSGSDLDGRNMGELIDSDKWDIVARCNKMYGNPKDVGTRLDYVFTRWQQWLDNKEFFTKEQLDNATEIVVLNQHTALKRWDSFCETEYWWLCNQVGHEHVSCGAQTIAFFLNRGAKSVDVIGFGSKEGRFLKDKVYTTGSKGTTPVNNTTKEGKDENPLYDWHKERQWEVNQAKVTFL